MDSGNSGGSLQSSSGGDEELDSRTGSFSNQSGHFGAIPIPNQPPMDRHHNPSPTFFDPPFHNLSSFQQLPINPNSNPNQNPNPDMPYNLDSIWSRGQGSEPNYFHNLGNLKGLSSYSESLVASSSSQALSDRSGSNQGPLQSTKSQLQHLNVAKNSKKRTRASRKTPTTVMTTDTTNFRQMVQEFTGIPAAPFSASPYSRRLDLFPISSTRSGPFESLYPLRPSALKPQPLPFRTSSSSPSFLNISTINSFNSSNYQLPPDLGLVAKQGPNLPDMENPRQKFQFPSTISQESSRVSTIGEMGVTHEHLHPSFRGFQGDHDQHHLGSFNGDQSEHVSSSYKLNCPASASDFRSEKGLENVSSMGDKGTINPSWVCPSD